MIHTNSLWDANINLKIDESIISQKKKHVTGPEYDDVIATGVDDLIIFSIS